MFSSFDEDKVEDDSGDSWSIWTQLFVYEKKCMWLSMA